MLGSQALVIGILLVNQRIAGVLGLVGVSQKDRKDVAVVGVVFWNPEWKKYSHWPGEGWACAWVCREGGRVQQERL